MDVRRVGSVIAFVILLFALATGSSKGIKRAGKVFWSNGIVSASPEIEVDEDMAEELLIKCRLDSVHMSKSNENLDLHFPEKIAIASNGINSKAQLLEKRNVQKAISALPPQTKETLLNCLRKKNLPFHISEEEDDSRNWYTKYLESLSGWTEPSRRLLGGVMHQSAATPAPSPVVESPTSSSQIHRFVKANVESDYESDDESDEKPSSHPLSSVLRLSTPGTPSSDNSDQNPVAVPVVATAAGTFAFAAMLFLCYNKWSRNSIDSGGKDDRPLLNLGSVGSSKNSCGNTVQTDEQGSQSFNTNILQDGRLSPLPSNLSANSIHSSSLCEAPLSGTIAGSTKFSGELSASSSILTPIPSLPLKPPPGRRVSSLKSNLSVKSDSGVPLSESSASFKSINAAISSFSRKPPSGRRASLKGILSGKSNIHDSSLVEVPLSESSASFKSTNAAISSLSQKPPSGRRSSLKGSLSGKSDIQIQPPPPPVSAATTPPPPPTTTVPGAPSPPSGPRPPPPPPGKRGPNPPNNPPPPVRPPLTPPGKGQPPLRPNGPHGAPDGFGLKGSNGPPKTKLKPFFWDKVLASPDQSMVWHQISSGSFQFNEEMIESLFGYAVADKTKTEQKKKPSSQDPSTQYIQLIDPKKSQNLAILLRALNVTTEEVCDALQEGNELPSELLQTLLKMAPTTEEELRLRLYTGPLSQLGHAERFLKVLVDIPFAFKRMESLLFMNSLQEESSGINESLAILEVACNEVRNSRLFLKLLEAVLKTGNRMNDGTFRGGAQAFKLDTLLKLVDVKGADGKTTLLHFVVQEIIRSEGIRAVRMARENPSISSVKTEDLLEENTPQETEDHYRSLGLQVVSGVGNELENVKKAAALDADNITGTVAKLGHMLIKTKEFLDTEMKSSEEDSGFHRTLKSFVEHAEKDITHLLEEEKRIMTLVKSTADYFHGRAGKDEGLRLFVIVRDFLIILEKVCKEVKESPQVPTKTPSNKEAANAQSSSDSGQPPAPPEPPPNIKTEG
ncbi:PREDICTED: formin-like protein 5 [Nelumbo nucifera]|uniref:Formin-like protein 5 n=2 Tax=Nelumbo nucifera TaxID=4432 RepID=A0A1U8AJF2_NELNU|nr:PREDICTED: formin-like protein 5 [Nelumbo nucifera]DAD23214.1 TPA_asm: hypothetical protein HUJ06_024677 [Nelumbo nucifera]